MARRAARGGRPDARRIDHAFSFPLAYFDRHAVEPDWPAFLDDFALHWPTDAVSVQSVRNGAVGAGAARAGDARWRRVADRRAGGAKSVFHFDVQGSVAKSTHAGLPWLRGLRRRFGAQVHWWPFDGWDVPARRSAVAEVYPALFSRAYPSEGRTPDQHDAYAVAAALAQAFAEGRLAAMLAPDLDARERARRRGRGLDPRRRSAAPGARARPRPMRTGAHDPNRQVWSCKSSL